MSLRHTGTEYDYDMEFVVDLSQWKPREGADDADEEFQHPASVVYTKAPYCFKPGRFDGTAEKVLENIEEELLEWRTLLMLNDCKDRKFKVTIHVEEVA